MIFKTGIILLASFLVMLTGYNFYSDETWYNRVQGCLLGIGSLLVFISVLIALLDAGWEVLP